MRLAKARVTKYRSIRDSGLFDVEPQKTIVVGPNEAGKSALLQALQQLNPPEGLARGFIPLRDYPRSEYNEITTKKVRPEDVIVVEGHFVLEEADQLAVSEEFRHCVFVRKRRLDNTAVDSLESGPSPSTFGDIKESLSKLALHADARVAGEDGPEPTLPSSYLAEITADWDNSEAIIDAAAEDLNSWLHEIALDETNEAERMRYEDLKKQVNFARRRQHAMDVLSQRVPTFVLFSNYFRVRPIIHLEHLATRIKTGVLDDDSYDYGNKCLLQMLGFRAEELSNLGKAAEPRMGDEEAWQRYRAALDSRAYQLNSASVRLSDEISAVWNPDHNRGEAERLRVVADGQYLKVVVEDALGVEIELDQRSEGFQWLVSFFVVFFAEAEDNHKNAILLLDEPGLSLHGLKQREFRDTVSRLAKGNQTMYTTHSPFLVGPDELDRVRVVELTDRIRGSLVHTTVSASDPAAMLPLQEALGYDLAQSLFVQKRNLVVEGLTDYWYIESVAQLFREAGFEAFDERIALVFAKNAGKVVYYATILHAQKLRVAALLDSDAAGDAAAKQDVLVHTLGNKAILRTKDAYDGPVDRPEIEDLLRDTLVGVAQEHLAWDVFVTASQQAARPIADVFTDEIASFAKYRLAKAFVKWSRDHKVTDLSESERRQWDRLFKAINSVLK